MIRYVIIFFLDDWISFVDIHNLQNYHIVKLTSDVLLKLMYQKNSQDFFKSCLKYKQNHIAMAIRFAEPYRSKH